MPTDASQFGQLLRRARTAAGLTREALSKLVKLNASYIYRLETGDRKPSREAVLLLGEALKVDGESLNQWLSAVGFAPVPVFNTEHSAVRTRRGAHLQRMATGEAAGDAAALWPAVFESLGVRDARAGRLLRAMSEARPQAREQVARLISDTVSYLLNALDSPVQTAVIPAAKENPFVAQSVMQRILLRSIGEAAASGVREIILVLAPGMVETIYAPLRAALNVTIVPRIELRYCVQPQPEGLGDAVLQAETLVKDRTFALVLPDDLVSEHAGLFEQQSELRRMTDALARQPASNFLLIAPVPKSKMPQYGVAVVGEREGDATDSRPVTHLVEKPDQQHSTRLPPGTFGVVGRYILQPEIFAPLKELKERGERPVHLTAALDLLIGAGRGVRAVELKVPRQDLGEALTRASEALKASDS